MRLETARGGEDPKAKDARSGFTHRGSGTIRRFHEFQRWAGLRPTNWISCLLRRFHETQVSTYRREKSGFDGSARTSSRH